MNADTLRQVEAIFERAVELPAEQRGPLLEELCAGDAGLRGLVEQLLHSHDAPGSGLLDQPLIAPPHSAAGAALLLPPPRHVGPYEIVRIIGEGGMAVVYEARQASPRRTVALKVTRPEFARRSFLRRFQREAEVLGQLQHPGIAHIYEAGVAELEGPDGTRPRQPYFAMELIRGLPLNTYAEHNKLSVPQRLELVARVCDAVQYAHQKGVIHRDLKPANILVSHEATEPPSQETGAVRNLEDAKPRGHEDKPDGNRNVSGLAHAAQGDEISPADLAGDRPDTGYRAFWTHQSNTAGDRTNSVERRGKTQPPESQHFSAIPQDRTRLLDGTADLIASHTRTRTSNGPGKPAEPVAEDRPRPANPDAEPGKTSAIKTTAPAVSATRHISGDVPGQTSSKKAPSLLDRLFLRRQDRPSASFAAPWLRGFVAFPKILDFGVARVTGPDMTAATMDTQAGQLIGTLAYMSPEQVSGNVEATDTRSDVYALGVILYELLGGRLPHATENVTLMEAIRRVRDDEPPRLGTLDRRLRGEIETIVHRALEKRRERRYQSAYDLSADLRRHLRGEAIEAKRDSALYVLRKTFHRYRGVLAIAIASVLALLAFGGWSVWQASVNRELADIARRSEQRAFAARDQANRLAADLSTELRHSNIERGRALALAGNSKDAEKLLWRAFLEQPSSASARWALCELYFHYPIVASLAAEVGTIQSLALSPDENVLAVGGVSGIVELWNMRTLRRIAALPGHAGEVRDLSFSADGARLASAGGDETVFVWDVARAVSLRALCGHQGRVTSVRFIPDGHLLTAGQDGTLRVWDVETGAALACVKAHETEILCVRISPDGRIAASGSRGRTIRLWDVELLMSSGLNAAVEAPFLEEGTDPVLVAALFGHLDIISSLAFSHDGQRLASTALNQDRTVRIWNVANRVCEAILKVPTGAATALAFAPDDATLYVGGWFTIDAWDVATHERIGRVASEPCTALVFSQTRGQLIATPYRDVRIWDPRPTPAVLNLGPDSGRSVAFSPDGRTLATSHRDGSVRLRDAHTGEVRKTFVPAGPSRPPDDPRFRVRSLGFDPSGRRLAWETSDRRAHLWDVEQGRSLQIVPNADFQAQQSIAFSSDGAAWSVARINRTFSIFRGDAVTPSLELPAMGTQALSLCFSPDGTMIATTSREPSVRLWSAAGEPLAQFGLNFTPWGVAFSPDNKTLAASTWLQTIELWDIPTRTHLASLQGHAATVWGVQFRPGDPDILVSYSGDGTVRLWSLSLRRNIATFEVCPGEEVLAAAFSPDGHWLAAACAGLEVRLWNLNFLDACIAGNSECQLERFGHEPGVSTDAAGVRAWTAQYLHSEK